MTNQQRVTREIIATGRLLALRGLVTARAGNISYCLDKKRILITATGSNLGSLSPRDIVCVDRETGKATSQRRPRPSSELPLHRAIYRAFPDTAIVHCHPPLVNAYFCVYAELKYLTFESRYYLGDVPVVGQKTLTVTDPRPVVAAMNKNAIVVVRNHGVFSRSRTLSRALERIEILEEAVKVYAIARLFRKKRLDTLEKELKKTFGAIRPHESE